MKLFELRRKLYHGNWREFEPGQILTAKKISFKRDAFNNVARVLEAYRPPGKPSRLKSIFMVTDPTEVSMAGGDDTYTYEVQPMSDVARVNQGWLGSLSHLYWESKVSGKRNITTKNRKAQELANNYWAGKPHPDRDLWEYMSEQVKVVRRVS